MVLLFSSGDIRTKSDADKDVSRAITINSLLKLLRVVSMSFLRVLVFIKITVNGKVSVYVLLSSTAMRAKNLKLVYGMFGL